MPEIDQQTGVLEDYELLFELKAAFESPRSERRPKTGSSGSHLVQDMFLSRAFG